MKPDLKSGQTNVLGPTRKKVSGHVGANQGGPRKPNCPTKTYVPTNDGRKRTQVREGLRSGRSGSENLAEGRKKS